MEKLIELLKEIKDDVNYENCTDLVDGHYLSSFEIIQIILLLDEEYDVEVPPAMIVPENFNSVNAIWNLIQRLSDD